MRAFDRKMWWKKEMALRVFLILKKIFPPISIHPPLELLLHLRKEDTDYINLKLSRKVTNAKQKAFIAREQHEPQA